MVVCPSWLQLSKQREVTRSRTQAPLTTPKPWKHVRLQKEILVVAAQESSTGFQLQPRWPQFKGQPTIWEGKWEEKRQKEEGVS